MPSVTDHYGVSGMLRVTKTTWAAAFGASTADSVLANFLSCNADGSGGASSRVIDRGYCILDLSSLAGAGVYNLSAFTFKAYLTSGYDTHVIPMNYGMTTFAPANYASPAVGDFGSFGASNLMAAYLTEPLSYVAGYKSFVANAAGLAAINAILATSNGKLGIGLRMDYDIANSDVGTGHYSFGSFTDDSNTGTSQDPKADFTYTYTAPAAGVPLRRRPSGLYIR